MWTDYLDNNKGLKSIFGANVPNLDNVTLTKINIYPTSLSMHVQLLDLSMPLPKRWVEKGFNACSFDFNFYRSDEQPIYKTTNLNVSQYSGMSISIEGEVDGMKKIVIKDASGNVYIEVMTDVIVLFGIEGFDKNNPE